VTTVADDREMYVRHCVEFGTMVPPAEAGRVLADLDRARSRLRELEKQLRELRGEKCDHWIDGADGERIAICPWSCTGRYS